MRIWMAYYHSLQLKWKTCRLKVFKIYFITVIIPLLLHIVTLHRGKTDRCRDGEEEQGGGGGGRGTKQQQKSLKTKENLRTTESEREK